MRQAHTTAGLRAAGSGAARARVVAEAGRAAAAVSSRVHADARAMLAIAAVVVLANAPSLLTFSNANPLVTRSGLASSVTAGPLPGQRAIDPNDGYTAQALGHRAALDWSRLQVPWWNPYEGTGAPLAGELQSAAFFPPTLLMLLANGQLYEHVLLEILTGLFTYLLLRRLSLGRWASATGAIAFALNGTFAWFSHAPVNPVAFLPALLLGVELAFSATAAGRRGGWWLIAVAGAGSFYAGFPETAYIDTLFGLCWFGWRCGCLPRERLAGFVRKAGYGAAVAVLLSAPLLVASLDYVFEATIGAHAGNLAGATHLPLRAAVQLVLPYAYGPIFAFGDAKLTLTGIWGHVGGFLSTSLVLLALLGLASRGRRALRLTLLAWIVLSMARIYGEPRLLRGVLGLVPGMSHVAFYRYAFPSLELAVTILAAIGLDGLAKRALPRRRLAMVAAGVLALVVAAALAARPLAQQRDTYLVRSAAFGIAVVLAIGGAALMRDSRTRVWLAALAVAGETAALFALPQASAPKSVALDTAPVAFLQRQIGTSRFFTLGPLQPNYGSYFGVGSLNVNDVPVPSAFANYVHTRLDTAVDPMVFVGTGAARPPSVPSPLRELLGNLRAYRAAGVAYVLTPRGTSLPESPTTFTLAFASASTRIYRLHGSTPYFTASRPACTVAPESRVSVRLSCQRRTELVRRETDLRGWSAKVDGHPVRVQRFGALFQAVEVAGGTHRVTFAYAPPHIWWGFAAFVAGGAWLLAAAATSRFSRSRG